MTTFPNLEEENINYVLETVEYIDSHTKSRRAGEKGEEETKNVFLHELMKYSDETKEQRFSTYPGAGTNIHRVLSVILAVCCVMFSVSTSNGYVFPVVISLVLNLIVFAIFSHKFLFDGTRLDVFSKRKRSANIIGTRYPRGNTELRVVLTAHMDSPLTLRGFVFGSKATYILSLISIVGNTILFCSQLIFLFAGAPVESGFFSFLSVVNIAFLPFHIASLIVVDSKKTTSGISASLIPSSVAISIMKQFADSGFRFEKAEICCLLTGSEYSGRAGAYAFAKRHRRLFSDVPTIFIPIEEITTSDKLSVFFKDGSGTQGSRAVASVIAQAADNLGLDLKNENGLLGTASFTPFSKYGFEACSIGTSKKYISRTVSSTADKITAVRRKTIHDVGSLIIETLNYYDN